MTPEGKVKKKINDLLKKYPEIYSYMPVPYGYGPSSLDYLLCVSGSFIAIEAKAPGNDPTPRQIETMRRIREAGGKVFIIDGTPHTDTLDQLERWIKLLFKVTV